jgi:hypothetical protein
MLLVGFLVSTKPLELSLPVLLIPFLLFALGIWSGAISLGMVWRKQQRPSRKIKVVASSLAAVLLLVVTLQSLGQLSWRDILLVVSLVLGLALYFYKTDLI